MKTQYDVPLWHAGTNQFIGYRARSAIVLNPYLSPDDVQMDDGAMQ